MAVVQYSNVYRTGADSGAPVTSLFIADTIAEGINIQGIIGDVMTAKDHPVLYYYHVNGWNPVVAQAQRFDITSPFIVSGPPHPLIGINTTLGPSAVRIYNINGALHLSSNCWFDGGNWHPDVAGVAGQIIVQNGANLYFYIVDGTTGAATATIYFTLNNGNIFASNLSLGGVIYERGRGAAIGEFQQFGVASGNFWCDGGMTFAVDLAQTFYFYTIIGKMLMITFNVSGTIGGTAGQSIYMHTPNGAYNATRADLGHASGYSPAFGVYPMRVGTFAGSNALFLQKGDAGLHILGQIYMQGQLFFEFN